MDIARLRRRLERARWRWMLPTLVGLAAVTSMARFAGEWLLFAVAAFWVVPLMLGYEMTRPALRKPVADWTVASFGWFLTVAPWVATIAVVVAAATLPGFDGVAIGLDSGGAWAFLPWFFAGVLATVVPWATWHVLRARGRPRERWVVIGYVAFFLVILAAIARLNAHWTGQQTEGGPLLVTGAILGGIAMLLHGFVRILWPYGVPPDAIEPPTLPDLAP